MSADPDQLLVAQVVNPTSSEIDLPGVRAEQTDHVLEQHTLAHPGFSDDHRRLPPLELEADPGEHFHGPESLVHVHQLDHRLVAVVR